MIIADVFGGKNVIGSVEALHFDIHTLRSAIENFSTHNKIGEGGFGTVYKVSNDNDTIVCAILERFHLELLWFFNSKWRPRFKYY